MIDPYNNDQIIKVVAFKDEDIEAAKRYNTETLNVVLYPVKDLAELDNLFIRYKLLGNHGRFESDEFCRKLFGCNNMELYELVKAQILKSADSIDAVSLPEQFLFSESVINPLDIPLLESYVAKTFTEEVAKKQALKKAYFKDNTDYIPIARDLPYMTSVEIIANKASFEDIPDGYKSNSLYGYISYKEWFEGLQFAEVGCITEEFVYQIPNWISEVRNVYYEYTNAKDGTTKNLKEYMLIELGWNPSIEFNEINRIKATNRFNESIKPKYAITDISMDSILEGNSKELIKPIIKSVLKPIYIVLVEGDNFFSKITKKVTKGPFSHAAISLDDSLTEMYSFNMNTNGKLGGLSIEDIKNYPQNHRLGVFTIFVKEKDVHTIQNVLDYYKDNIRKTSYSILNILALPLNKAIKMDFSMICSEFVDNILKLCNIKLTTKESPLVTPNDFFRAADNNGKIYKVYDGPVNSYSIDKAHNKIFRLLNSGSSYIKECTLLEAKEFPIQFSDDGDLLINNIGKLNYEEEYQKSHKLLLAYRKSTNIDGMKYELSKLWLLNQLLEKDIYAKKNVIANSKCRSRVLNDFNTYFDEVLKYDKSFNFGEYYNASPFSNATIKIKGSTLKYSAGLLKKLLKSMV